MEELSQIPLQVSGQVPEWLSGYLVRNGPVYEIVNGQQITHWFDGLAMLHCFNFESGQVLYTNRYLRTDAYKAVFEGKSLHYLGFAVDPCRSLFKKFLTLFSYPLHNANINVAKVADEYAALFEIPLPVSFNPKTLETLGVVDYADRLPKRICWESAHPHQDGSGILNYLVTYGRKSFYNLYRIKAGTKRRDLIAKIPVEKPSYMHSFAKTEHFAILAQYPFVVDPLAFITGSKPFIYNYHWDPSRKTEFLVINLDTGQVVGKYQSNSFFSFHHVNAYEEGDKIHLDIICYKDAKIIEGIKNYFRPLEPFSDESPYKSELKRFTLDRKSGSCESMTLFSTYCEFPRINPNCDGQKYRYVYMINPLDNHSGPGLRPIYKLDHHLMETKSWSEEGCFPGEPVFVPKPNASSEDDGVILSVINDLHRYSTFLLVLDGKTFTEIGRLKTPQMIPPGLHGQFI